MMWPPARVQVPSGAYMAFGPAQPRAVNRFMAAADVVAGGFENGNPWADRLFLGGYSNCVAATATSPASGVCPTSQYLAAGAPASAKLTMANQSGGVTTLYLSRPLAGSTPGAFVNGQAVSLAINGGNAVYVFAKGLLSPAGCTGLSPGYRIVQHALTPDDYNSLEIDLAACPGVRNWAYPLSSSRPLTRLAPF